jgi:hypothetical protein
LTCTVAALTALPEAWGVVSLKFPTEKLSLGFGQFTASIELFSRPSFSLEATIHPVPLYVSARVFSTDPFE